MSNRIIRACLAGLFVWGALSGCSKDSTTGPASPHQATAPALPSVSTMKPALDFYGVATPNLDRQSLATGSPSSALQAGAGDHSNWINAYVRAVFLYLSTYDLLDKPIGAFAVAIHSVPQLQADGSYLWTYIFANTGIEYSVFLYGTPNGDKVTWRMEVSSNNPAQPLDHFVWFSGESATDNTGGFWQFYQPVDATNGSETLRIDWSKSGIHEGTFKLTVNGASLPNVGDTLAFTKGMGMSSIEYFAASANVTSSIVWHADGTGSITVPDYNGGVMACWDMHQVNVVCP
jgi:hypothetical protein